MAIVSHCCTDLCFCVFSRQQFLESAQDVGPKWSLCYSLLQCVAVRWGSRAVESVINLQICYSSCRLNDVGLHAKSLWHSSKWNAPHGWYSDSAFNQKMESHIDRWRPKWFPSLSSPCSKLQCALQCVLVCFPVRAAVRVALFALLRASSCAFGMGRLMWVGSIKW